MTVQWKTGKRRFCKESYIYMVYRQMHIHELKQNPMNIFFIVDMLIRITERLFFEANKK